MQLNVQKKIASKILKISKKHIRIDNTRLDEIKEAITKADLRSLIKDKAIVKTPKKGISKGRTRKTKEQKRKGKQKGPGSRKGKQTARLPKKERWMNAIRSQRKLLKELKDEGKLNTKSYRDLYRKAKGGFFRSKRHINLYITEHRLTTENGKKKTTHSTL